MSKKGIEKQWINLYESKPEKIIEVPVYEYREG
jgi:hypothetical protein